MITPLLVNYTHSNNMVLAMTPSITVHMHTFTHIVIGPSLEHVTTKASETSPGPFKQELVKEGESLS